MEVLHCMIFFRVISNFVIDRDIKKIFKFSDFEFTRKKIFAITGILFQNLM